MEHSEIIIYQSEDGNSKVEVRLEGETVWLTLNQLAELFQKAKSTISEHIKNVFEETELPMNDATVRNFRTVQTEGSIAYHDNSAYFCRIRTTAQSFYRPTWLNTNSKKPFGPPPIF